MGKFKLKGLFWAFAVLKNKSIPIKTIKIAKILFIQITYFMLGDLFKRIKFYRFKRIAGDFIKRIGPCRFKRVNCFGRFLSFGLGYCSGVSLRLIITNFMAVVITAAHSQKNGDYNGKNPKHW